MNAIKPETTPGVLATLKETPTPVRYLLGGVLINQMGAFVQTFLVLYLTVQGLSLGQAGISLAAYSAGAVFGTLVGGELTHRFGARTTIVTSMVTSGVLVGSFPLLSSAELFWQLLVTVALAGLATQSYRPAAAVMLSDLMPEQHRVMAFSMMRIALNVGAAVGPLIAAGLILVDWDSLFWFDAVTALLYAALAMWVLPKNPASAGETTETIASAEDRRSAYAVMLRDGRFLLYLASMLLGAAIYVQYTVALPLKIAAEGHPTALYSIVLATSSIILITCELKVTTYVRNWPSNMAGTLGTALLGLGLAGYGLSSQSSALIIVSTVVFVSGLMVSGPTMFAHPTKAPVAVKARYVGTSQAMFGLGSALGPALGVAAWSSLGNGVWLVCGLVGGVAALCALVGMKASPALEPTGTEVEQTA